MQRVTVLSSQQQFRINPAFYHLRRAPLACDHGVMAEMPPEIVGEKLRATVLFPSPADLKTFRVHDKDSAGTAAFIRADGVDVNAVRAAMRCVGSAVSAFFHDHFRLNDFDDARFAG